MWIANPRKNTVHHAGSGSASGPLRAGEDDEPDQPQADRRLVLDPCVRGDAYSGEDGEAEQVTRQALPARPRSRAPLSWSVLMRVAHQDPRDTQEGVYDR